MNDSIERYSPHRAIVAVCESFLEKYGDSDLGVGWPREDASIRYQVMLDVLRPSLTPISILDFGCGTSRLNDYIRSNGYDHIIYSGLDLSERFLEISRTKFPEVDYYRVDLMDSRPGSLPRFDYIIMNGIFNFKGNYSYEQMFSYLRALVGQVFDLADIGIAFNVMSKQVEWERDDLFHLPVDVLLSYLSREVSRHIQVRHDYGLYEYTVYVYQEAYGDTQRKAKKVLGGSGTQY
jgi:SAM-dependent methyltransferase